MKIKLLIISIVVLGFASCKKEASSPEPTYSITGKWYLVQSRQIQTPAGGPKSTVYINRNHTDYIQFNNNNTGEEAITPWQGTQSKQTFNYQASDKVITLNFTGSAPVTRQIMNISSTLLTLSQATKDVNGNVIVTLEADYTNQ